MKRGICYQINLVTQRVRGALLASTALLASPAAAFAEDTASRPIDALDVPQASSVIIDGLNKAAQDVLSRNSHLPFLIDCAEKEQGRLPKSRAAFSVVEDI